MRSSKVKLKINYNSKKMFLFFYQIYLLHHFKLPETPKRNILFKNRQKRAKCIEQQAAIKYVIPFFHNFSTLSLRLKLILRTIIKLN
jgi:hypothetical protein